MAPQAGPWLGELHDALVRRQYDYVLLGPDSTNFFLATLVRDSGYVRTGPLFPPNDQLWTWRRSGSNTPPGMLITPRVDVYVPRERALSAGEISRPEAP